MMNLNGNNFSFSARVKRQEIKINKNNRITCSNNVWCAPQANKKTRQKITCPQFHNHYIYWNQKYYSLVLGFHKVSFVWRFMLQFFTFRSLTNYCVSSRSKFMAPMKLSRHCCSTTHTNGSETATTVKTQPLNSMLLRMKRSSKNLLMAWWKLTSPQQ